MKSTARDGSIKNKVFEYDDFKPDKIAIVDLTVQSSLANETDH